MRGNSYTVRFTHLMYKSQSFFTLFTELCHHHHDQLENIVSPHKEKLYTFNFPSTFAWSPRQSLIYSLYIPLPIQNISLRNESMQYVFLCVCIFLSFSIMLSRFNHVVACSRTSLLLWWNNISSYEYITFD